MRYIITQSQLHSIVYRYLDEMFSNEDFRKKNNPHVEDGSTWRVDMYSKNGKDKISYFFVIENKFGYYANYKIKIFFLGIGFSILPSNCCWSKFSKFFESRKIIDYSELLQRP